jgi:N-acetylglucosamine-6-phosphate deacetylase
MGRLFGKGGANTMNLKIFSGRLVNPRYVQEEIVIEIAEGRVISIRPQAESTPEGSDIDLRKSTVIPGLIDIHIHGAAGDDFMTGQVEKAVEYLARHGTTSFLATSYPCGRDTYLEGIRRLRQKVKEQNKKGAKILGIHLEGPFLNPKYGAQKGEYCWPINKENTKTMLSETGEALKMVSLSPELPGAVEAVRMFSEHGIITSAAHTEADTEQMQAVYNCGLRHTTHILNAIEAPPTRIKGVRRAGCDEFTLASEDMTADVMVDSKGIHVEDEWLKIIFKCLGVKRTALLSDAIPFAGLPPGLYTFGDGQKFKLTGTEDVGRTTDGKLAGSVMMMLDAVNNLMDRLGLKLEEAIECATLTPARIIGVKNFKGSIEVGKDADLVALDERRQVLLTMVEGKIVYQAEELGREKTICLK